MYPQMTSSLLALLLASAWRYSYACSSGGGGGGGSIEEGIRQVLGGNVGVEPFTSGSTNQFVTSCRDLDCTFESGTCRWINVQGEDELDWLVVTGQPDAAKWQRATGTSEIPVSPWGAVITNRQSSATRGLFVSDPIECQSGGGELSFDYYLSPQTELRACWRFFGSPDFEFCTPALSRSSSSVTVPIDQAIDAPFELVLEARNFVFSQGGFAFIDNLDYCADFSCTGTGTTSGPGPSGDTCRDLTCGFDSSFCAYSSETNNAATGRWEVLSPPIGNAHTGIDSDPSGGLSSVAVSGYPDTHLDVSDPNLQHSLSSPRVNVPSGRVLRFNRYQATAGTELKVCRDTPSNCFWTSPPLSRGSDASILSNFDWKEEEVQLPPGDYNLIFVSQYDGSGKMNVGVTGLSDVQLLDSATNQRLC